MLRNRALRPLEALTRRSFAAGLRAAVGGLSALSLSLVWTAPASAQGTPRRIIRDAEIEQLFQDYARPIFKAAGVRAQAIEILMIPDRSFNAFVAGPRQMFINSGTLLSTKTPNEMIGIIAHETGHLAHGHLIRMQQAVQDAQLSAMIGGAIAMAAMAGGAIAGNNSVAQGGMGALMGVTEMARRDVLAYARGIELEADRAGISYLEASGQSPKGMLDTFERLADDNLISARNANPYLLTHPLPRERIALIEDLVRKSKFLSRVDPPALQLRHDLAKAKLAAFTNDSETISRLYGPGQSSLPARYAQAIIAYRTQGADRAMPLIDGIIQAQPGNPFFWEIKGQALLEGGRPRQAIEPLRKAVSLAPQSGLLHILLGQALVDSGDKSFTDEAIKNLTIGLQAAPSAANGYRALGRAYAARGDIGMAQLATAQGLMAEGDMREAKTQASRAREKLKEGSPGWLRADDIVSYKPKPASG